MIDSDDLMEALALLAEHGGTIEFARLVDGTTMLQVWFQSMDISASQPVDPADRAQIARVIVEYARQFCEQWERRN